MPYFFESLEMSNDKIVAKFSTSTVFTQSKGVY